MRLLDLERSVERRVFETGSVQPVGPHLPVVRSFHPKAYIFALGDGGTAFVGSSNLSESALTSAVEWNYRVVSSHDGAGYAETRMWQGSPSRVAESATVDPAVGRWQGGMRGIRNS